MNGSNPPKHQILSLPDSAKINSQLKRVNGWWVYILWMVLLNGGIWGGALAYLKIAKPKYVSKLAIILPGGNVGSNVNLPSIGQASSSSTSAAGGSSLDPRANYQFILNDDLTLEEVAENLRIKPSELGKPKSKLVDNTSILQIEIEGPSAKAAQERGYALYTTLMSKISKLRQDEINRRDEGTQNTLDLAKQKLADSQQKLASYKSRSGLSNSDQVKELAVILEQLRKQRAEMLAQSVLLGDRVAQLSSSLGLSVEEASAAFILQADPIYQQTLRDYSEATTSLNVFQSKWGDNHPQIVKERTRQSAARTALVQRANLITGREPSLQELARINLNLAGNAGKESLYRDLVAVTAEQKGVTAQAEELSQQIIEFEIRLRDLTQKQLELDRLQRDAQVAEAVFASSLAKIDLSKSDLFTAYPLAQLLSPPSLANEAAAPQPKLVLAGAFVGSLLVSTGIFLLWLKKIKDTAVQIKEPSKESILEPILEPILETTEFPNLRAIHTNENTKTG